MAHNSLKRGVLQASALLLLMSGVAVAGDNTQINFLGYSAQGRYFAYEEFGLDDAKKIAFSQIYVVDLTQNTWVVGTPLRFEAFISATSLLGVREQLRTNARVLLDGLQIDTPAIIAAFNGDGETQIDTNEMNFSVPGQLAPGTGVDNFTITLNTFETSAASACEEIIGQAPLGFSLGLEAMSDRLQLFEDDTLPYSRGCPSAYQIKGVVMPFGARDISDAVAIVSVITQETKIRERRFMVVPLAYDAMGLR